MEFRAVNDNETGLPRTAEDQELRIKILVTHFYQGVFRHLEGRETVLSRQMMFPPARTVFCLTTNMLSQPSTAQHHIVERLCSSGIDNGLAEHMATHILSRCQRTSPPRPSNHFSFRVSVTLNDVVFDEGESGERIDNFDEILAYYRSNSGLGVFDFDIGGANRSANNGVSTSVLEKLRAERRVDGTNGSIEGSCAICFDDFLTATELIDMPCGHVFHESCIFSWLRTTDSCPLCRQRVDL